MKLERLGFIRSIGYFRFVSRYLRLKIRKVLRGDTLYRLPNGSSMTLFADSLYANDIWYTGAYVDQGAEYFAARLLPKEGTFLDVGSNIGYWALTLSHQAGSIICFEPDPRAMAKLQRNIGGKANIKVTASALSDFVGTAALRLGAGSETSTLVFEKDVSGKLPTGTNERVRVQTLDAFVHESGITHVDLIKVDAEGSDIRILRGSAEVVKRLRPVLVIEANEERETIFNDFLPRFDYCCGGFTTPMQASQTRHEPFVVVANVAQARRVKMLFLIPRERFAEAEQIAHTDR